MPRKKAPPKEKPPAVVPQPIVVRVHKRDDTKDGFFQWAWAKQLAKLKGK